MLDASAPTPRDAGSTTAPGAVLFDYGGVLTTPVRDSITAWMELDGIEPASFTRTLRAWLSRDAPAGSPIHRLETGELDLESFEVQLAAALRTTNGGPVVAAGVLTRLFAGLRIEQRMVDLAAELRAAGIRVGLLSNSWGNDYPRVLIDELLDPIVISEEVGLRKPDVAIYQLAVARLGLPAERVLFVDDAEPNVLGARAAGLQALHHHDPGATRAAVAALVGLPHISETTGADHV